MSLSGTEVKLDYILTGIRERAVELADDIRTQPSRELNGSANVELGREILVNLGGFAYLLLAGSEDIHDLDEVDSIRRGMEGVQFTLERIDLTKPISHQIILLQDICERSIEICLYIIQVRRDKGPGPKERDAISAIFERFSSLNSALGAVTDRTAARSAAEEAREAAEASKVAAGIAADNTLGDHYSDIAIEELKSAKRFRVAAIGGFVLSVCMAGYIAFAIISDHDEGIGSQLFKLAVTLPILAVAFYLAHEANSHRMVARRAKEVEIRLKTLEAFLAPLEVDQRTILRAKVGESILSGPLALSIGTDKQPIDTQAIIEKLVDKVG
jgi:hypothetical protein